jgi:hypothetical protein
MACGSMAEADALALLKLLQQVCIDIDPHRDLARFTDFAVQIRYDHQPDLQNLDRSSWNSRAEALLSFIEAMLPPPALP